MEKLTYNQIKKKVGEAWALIYNPEYSENTGKLIMGELIDFNDNKKDLITIVENDKTKNLHFTIKWFGKLPDDKIILNLHWNQFLENYAIGKAIEEGMKTDDVSKDDILKVLRK
jgi:hypothetical protein